VEPRDREPRPPGQSALDAYPELDFTPEWGSLVRRARSDKGWSQADLAREIGCEQPLISYIESGKLGSSKAVVPIADKLGIPVPRQFVGDDLDERWADAGRILRRMSLVTFRALLNAAEQAIADSQPDPH